MNIDIEAKLVGVLKQKQFSERDVVYFLIELYKFLERKYDKELGNGRYDVITFYRNWICHSYLHGDSYKIFKGFKELIKEQTSKPNALGLFDWIDSIGDKTKEYFREYSPLFLKQEIRSFLYEINYNGKFDWESFRENLYQVIVNIPLYIKDDKTILFSFECIQFIQKNRYDELEIKVVIPGVCEYHFSLDDQSLAMV